MERILAALLGLEGWLAAILLSLLPLLEASALLGILVPGETALVLGGVLVYYGRVALPVMLVAGSLGAVIGDSIGYWVGRRWGDRMLAGRVSRLVGAARLERTRRHMREGGFGAVAIGRYAPGVRSVVPMLAGASRMPYGRFLGANLLGGVTWAVGSVLIGWLAGAAWAQVHHAVLLALVAIFAAAALVHWLRRRRQPTEGSIG